MSDEPLPIHRAFSRARLDDRQVNELIGLAHGIIADGIVSQAEAEHLQKWLVANRAAHQNPVIQTLLKRVDEMLHDDHLDREEAAELFDTLERFVGGNFEIGELLKSTTLPLDDPAPEITFPGSRICFTGTFAYGSRRDCTNAVTPFGASVGSLTQTTDYLIVGIYATDSWAHSSYGRKIEKGVKYREAGIPLAIVGEEHWLSHLPSV